MWAKVPESNRFRRYIPFSGERPTPKSALARYDRGITVLSGWGGRNPQKTRGDGTAHLAQFVDDLIGGCAEAHRHGSITNIGNGCGSMFLRLA